MTECPCPFCSGYFEYQDSPPRMEEKSEQLKPPSYLGSVLDSEPTPPIPWDYPEDERDK